MDLVGLIRRVVRAELEARAPTGAPVFGIVEAVHLPDAEGRRPYACDVRLHGAAAVHEAVPVASGYLGAVAPPAVGDMVVLAHVDGDPDQPVVVGFVWSDTTPPPEVAADACVLRLPHHAAPADRLEARAAAGANGARSWSVDLPEGPRLEAADSVLRARLGDHALELDGEAGTVTVTSGGATVTLDASGAVTIAGDGDIAIRAGANLRIEAGGNAEISARGSMALSATRIDLN
ncbi:phage baseplate assembly protein V [Rhodobaculum claviforme]|uniref:Gp5/Type VI secretion system Vgr protein OB-fold domain-containing protein n=1 Tax=Rhodobaculum claviforme TaxID=1549854 RepID=A0A934TIM8_9RHOB|nr:phage baseplate assembly protein V [Rhodobaculum claviforme]MBK5926171.1 hypothetical protein [Rhodobaculum claviforme]